MKYCSVYNKYLKRMGHFLKFIKKNFHSSPHIISLCMTCLGSRVGLYGLFNVRLPTPSNKPFKSQVQPNTFLNSLEYVTTMQKKHH